MKKENEKTQNKELEVIMYEAIEHMSGLGYTQGRITQCRNIWESLIIFAKKHRHAALSDEMLAEFTKSNVQNRTVRNFRKRHPAEFHTILMMLKEFSQNGFWRIRRGKIKKPDLPASLAGALHEFIRYWKDDRFMAPFTCECAQHYLSGFLKHLDVNGIRSWKEFRPETISGYISSLNYLKPKSISSVFHALRAFLRYLYMESIVLCDYSNRVPSLRIPADRQLPSAWTHEEMDALMSAVDRSTPMGKRDYAILLLGYRLGMRPGDIRELRLENIHWDDARISLNQSKTGKPLSLPLTEEVGEALIDYLLHARPPVPYRQVFLRLNAPIQPFCDRNRFYEIIKFYRLKADIPKNGKRGMHSLRHTAACRLLEVDTPLETISDILGHSSLESTRTYAKADISGLRTAALDPEEVFHA